MRRALGGLIALPLLAGTAPAWAISGLMVRCDIEGAEVAVKNGPRLGTCPGRFTLEPGTYQVRIRKDLDAETEWFWEGEVRLADDEVTKVATELKKRRTKLGMEREMERQEQEQRLAAARAEKLSGEFVTIPGGDFQMGDLYGDGGWDEKPVHQVRIKDFKLAKYEVTQGFWRQVMGSNPSDFKDCGDDCPVEKVSFDDVQTFITKLNAQTGKHYRLPTEAEWEYACRSGGKQQRYCGGDDLDALGWFHKNSGDKTHPVGAKRPNGLGLFDMSGNVYEWTCSEWQSPYAGNEKVCADGAARRVVRGGSWLYPPVDARVSYRGRYGWDLRDVWLGVRLAQDL